MKIKKTLSVILMILLSTIILNIVSIIFSGSRGLSATSDPEKVFLFGIIQAVIIAAVLGVTVWMMVVWNAGDKLPPAFMLILGVLGACPFIVYTFDPSLVFHVCSGIPFLPTRMAFDISDSASEFMWYFLTGLLPFLYIGFGITGFFTKRKTG